MPLIVQRQADSESFVSSVHSGLSFFARLSSPFTPMLRR